MGKLSKPCSVLCLALVGTSCTLDEMDEVSSETHETLHPGWVNITVDSAELARNRDAAITDVLYMGGKRFVVAYIVQATGQQDGYGHLRFKRYDVDTGLKSGSTTTATNTVSWVRAMAGGPIIIGVCGVTLAGAGAQDHRGFFAFQYESSVFGSSVYLQRHRWCLGTFETSQHFVGFGRRPSVAAGFGGNPLGWKLLTVYGRNNVVYGRLMGETGSALGSEFTIYTLPVGVTVFSTDIVWISAVSRFVVGFIGRQQSTSCDAYNVRVTFGGTVETVSHRGICDADVGGHHTSVAYDPRTSTNPDHYYAWWYQDETGEKATRLMDTTGAPTGVEVAVPASGFTRPVTRRRDDTDAIAGAYATVEYDAATTAQRLWAFTSPGGAVSTMETLATGVDGGIPLAVGALESDTVVIWQDCTPETGCQWADPWYLAVSDH